MKENEWLWFIKDGQMHYRYGDPNMITGYWSNGYNLEGEKIILNVQSDERVEDSPETLRWLNKIRDLGKIISYNDFVTGNEGYGSIGDKVVINDDGLRYSSDRMFKVFDASRNTNSADNYSNCVGIIKGVGKHPTSGVPVCHIELQGGQNIITARCNDAYSISPTALENEEVFLPRSLGSRICNAVGVSYPIIPVLDTAIEGIKKGIEEYYKEETEFKIQTLKSMDIF